MTTSPVAPAGAVPPVELNSFIGRQRELADVRGLLATTRLLTLTGAGGSGKTRLAAEAVTGMASRYADGIAWVEFSSLRDATLVPLHVAAALEVRDHPGLSPEEGLRVEIQSREMLLVLDSCEHVVDAAARLATSPLRGCPGLTILATSREALGVPGERAWLVPPLALPRDEDAGGDPSESEQLFVDRARAVLPAFDLSDANRGAVARICARLDGIPLALELAAARIRVLPPERLAERLDDAFKVLTAGSRTALPRHKTLRETIDWSYELLSEREQALLQRLAVFGGSFTLEAVEQVCADDRVSAGEILDVLAALVDKSLVNLELRGQEARYGLLDTMRQYALDKLGAADTVDRWRERQAHWALTLAEEAAPHIFGGASDEGWLRRLDAEADNLRAAAIWAEAAPSRADVALRLCIALHWYWYALGRFREGRQRLDMALRHPDDVPPLTRALALLAYGHVGLWQGEAGGMVPPLREALAILRAEGEPHQVAYGLASLGAGLCLSGEVAEARVVLAECLQIVDQLPEQVLSAFSRYWDGIAALADGDVQHALATLETGLDIAWRIGNQPSIGHSLAMLGRVHWSRGDLDHSLAAYREALAVHAAIHDAWGLVQAIEGIARIRLARGDTARGICLVSGAAALRDQLAVPLVSAEQADIDSAIAAVKGELPEDEFAAVWAKGRHLRRPALVAMALEVDRHDVPLSITAERPIPAVPAGPRPSLAVRSLGTVDVRCNGTPLPTDRWGSAKARELLLLLLTRRAGMTKEEVGVLFWPEASTAQVRNSFHVTLHRLRRALGHADWVVTDGDRYRVKPGLRVEFDADEFEQAVLLALRAADRHAADAVSQLQEALAMYGGPFLAGEAVGDWHLDTRDRLQVLAARAAPALGRALEDRGDHAGASAAYRQLVAIDDLHEEGTRLLMAALARQGERAQALRLYGRLRDRLARELDLEPEEQTTALYERIHRGDGG